MNYRFLVNRLKNASYGELLFRAKGFTLNLKLRHFTRSRPVFHGLEDDKDKIRGLEMPDLDIAMPDPLSTDVLGRTPYTLNTDHRSITECETKWGTVFWSDIRYQNSSVDIRAVLEPSRLQHITTLLVYSQRTKDNNLSREALRLAKASLLSWLPKNPFLFGPNYISALECALRIPVFFYCLKMLDALSERDFTQLLRTVYEHTWWVAHRLSLYSSLGNHTIAEAVGLVFGGAIYGGSSEGKVWLGKGIGLLEQELSHQILDDGGPAEQSFDYHRFVLDLYWLAVDFCERNELHDCGPWMHRLTRGEEFLASVAMAGRLPSIGDSDAGHAVASDVVPSRPVTETKMERVRTFPGAGYSIVRTTSNAVLVFDHGSLGMAPLYNHGHADALSLVLYKDGEEMLVDPGTYRYHGVPEWRSYFKGTRAHNTVTVDGLDQAVQETGFIWSKPYRSVLSRTKERDGSFALEGMNDGYARLRQPVRHTRLICLMNGQDFVVRDTFSGMGKHRFELNFHLHPDAFVKDEARWLAIRKGDSEIGITLAGAGAFSVVRGQESPHFGWYSSIYGIRMPSSVLTHSKEGRPDDVTFLTVISTGRSRPDVARMEEVVCQL